MCAREALKTGKPAMMTDQTSKTPSAAAVLSLKLPLNGDLNLELQDHIGRQLREVYDEVLNEPVPDRFLRLVADLERKLAGKA